MLYRRKNDVACIACVVVYLLPRIVGRKTSSLIVPCPLKGHFYIAFIFRVEIRMTLGDRDVEVLYGATWSLGIYDLFNNLLT